MNYIGVSKVQFKIKYLKLLLEKKYDDVPKALGKELVELGFMNYKKLTPENYDYWWYEVEDNKLINKNSYTFDWADLVPTEKMGFLKIFIKYHNDEESIYKLINIILEMHAATCDNDYGVAEEIINRNYNSKFKNNKQIQLTF